MTTTFKGLRSFIVMVAATAAACLIIIPITSWATNPGAHQTGAAANRA